MIKFVSAKCPSCGATLRLSKEDEKVRCEYCHQDIIVDDAIACYKLKLSGNVNVDGISTNSDLIEAANELLDMGEFLKAKRKFLEFSEKCPDKYQGWLGLLICRTRNFTIKDNNIMFENDVNKYYEHFLRVAPEEIKEQYLETIENYFNPNTNNLEINTNLNQDKSQLQQEKTKVSTSSKKNNTWLWVIGWIFCFPIPLTILIWKSNWTQSVKIIITVLLWLFIFILGATNDDTTNNTNVAQTSVETTQNTN